MTNQTTAAEVAARMEKARDANDRPVTWLAEHTGYGDKTLRRHRLQPEKYTLGEIIAIAAVLQCPVESFFTDQPALAEAV